VTASSTDHAAAPPCWRTPAPWAREKASKPQKRAGWRQGGGTGTQSGPDRRCKCSEAGRAGGHRLHRSNEKPPRGASIRSAIAKERCPGDHVTAVTKGNNACKCQIPRRVFRLHTFFRLDSKFEFRFPDPLSGHLLLVPLSGGQPAAPREREARSSRFPVYS